MSRPDPVFGGDVLGALARAKDLPSMPAVAMEVLRVARDEEAGADDLAAVVSLDPALAAKILKVANSPLFIGRAEITSLQRACAQLGFRTVKVMALSFALVDSLGRPEVEGFDYDEYWKRSVVRAVSAKLLAEKVAPKLADEAFLSGLFSRIGQLLLASCLSGEYQPVLAASTGNWPSLDLEQSTLGYSSEQLGSALLRSWNLPPLIYEAVLCANRLSEFEDLPARTKELACILRLATSCEELACSSCTSKALAQLHRSAEVSFGLDPETIEGLLSQLDRRTTEIAESLRVEIKGSLDMSVLLREAQQEMLRETLGLLHDAVASEQRAAQLQAENSHLLRRAQTDPLTGLANRNTFQEALATWVEQAPTGDCPQPVGLLMIDVDYFKKVNDSYGHPVGDQVLRLIARVVREVTGDCALAARYGGEEFTVVLRQTSVDQLKEVAERIRTAIERQRLPTARGELMVTVSIGGAHTGAFEKPATPDKLVKAADRCLYQAKQAGRNRCSFAGAEIHPDPVQD